MAKPSNPTPTRAEAHILLALLDGQLHGYAIMQKVEALSAGRTRLGAGTLYTAIARLTDRQWIEEAAPAADEDERRRNYRLTSAGRKILREEAREWDRLAASARTLLTGGAR